jgi:hypothetical protein
MRKNRPGDSPAEAIQDTFGSLVDELFATFQEELCVAESIDMFHLTREDWDSHQLAMFTVAYVALLYRQIFAIAADQGDIERIIGLEAQRAAEKLRVRQQTDDGLAAHIEQLSVEWRASKPTGRDDTPFSRTPEAIRFTCRHLVKPASRAKAENLALMPFLQVYLPERASRIQQLAEA